MERGVEGARRRLSCRCCLEFSDTRAREHDSPCGFLCSLTRKHKLLITQQGRPCPGGPPGAGFGGGKGTNSVGTISSPGVLRLRALNAVSPDKICEARRSVEKHLNERSAEPQVPPLRFAPVGMTRKWKRLHRKWLPVRFFITLGGPRAHPTLGMTNRRGLLKGRGLLPRDRTVA